ncbi:hypothetical protein [Bradyrhizobium valentinum]|uniref:Uncharacterized protein n=1 Tax=Bradyrhizobium valentinum TaxID=1518501 RepID=A0A0R3L5L4_9BRAD|nr:hypothetical protein [Bradyrhizobium valentinum]KRR03082.1 hypothetical protein CP49_03790 [Bradyrhizobium valentinum]
MTPSQSSRSTGPEVSNAIDGPAAAALAEAFRRFDAENSLSVADGRRVAALRVGSLAPEAAHLTQLRARSPERWYRWLRLLDDLNLLRFA